MKEFRVLEIKCNKEFTLLDLFYIISQIITYDSNFFAIQNLEIEKLNKKAYELYNNLNLNRYEYKEILKHLSETSYYNPKYHDLNMISNLDECWNWYNKRLHEPMNNEDFKNLFVFCDLLRTSDVSTLMLGFDKIRWENKEVGKGTYGFEKADCTYGLGENYLSNSIIIGRTNQSKTYSAFISFERCFQNLEVIDTLVNQLGVIINQEVYFAPENEAERKKWSEVFENEKFNFESSISGMKELNLECSPRMYELGCSRNLNKINIKKYIEQYLCSDGWKKRSARKYEYPTVIHKYKGNKEISFSILSGHNGHHLQLIIYYRGNEFLFSHNLDNLFAFIQTDQDAEKFFCNIIKVRDYFYTLL